MGLKIIQSVLILLAVFQGIYCQNDWINCTYNGDPYNYYCELMINNTQGFNDFKDISGKHFNTSTDSDVRYVHCYNNIVSLNIPSIICEKFQNIVDFQFYYVGIERIDSYSFKGCKNLTNLYLHYNRISTIDEQAFANNYNLQNLDLSKNRISVLPEKLFLSQYNLGHLNFYGNQLFDIPENIFQPLKSLVYLYLGENYMKKIKPEWFETLGTLVHLDMSNSNLTEELPRNLFEGLKNISFISLRNSKIKVIHADTFGISLSIAHIDLGYNRIYAVDEKFIDNTGPSYLDFYGNICADVSISDSSMSRKQMRADLNECFEFYKMLIENNPSTTESSIATTGKTSTTSSSLNEKIQSIEDEVKILMKNNEEIIENWKIQYLATEENKVEIVKLQTLGYDLKKEMQQLSLSIDEINAKSEGGVKSKDLTPPNVGNNFVSINIDGYPKHEKN